MNARSLILLIIIIAIMAWIGFRIRNSNSMLSVALLSASTLLLLIIVGAATGLIGG